MRDGLPWPLVLVQQRDGANQRQIFHVVAPRPGLAVEEGQFPRVRIGYEERLEQPLRVAMDCRIVFAVLPRQQPFERLRLALLFVDGLGLRAVFVHRQHQAAIQQLFVQVYRRGGEEDHHRAFDAILMRDEPPRRGVFARCSRWSARLRDCNSFSA